MQAKYKGFCSTCHLTIWKNEWITVVDKKITHRDCLKSVADKTPREFDPRWLSLPGGSPELSKFRRKARKALSLRGD